MTDMVRYLPLANGLMLGMGVLLYWARRRRFSRSNRKRRSHHRNIGKADQLLSLIQSEERPPAIYKLVRGTTPYIFEEMVLSAFENCGATALRNRRYTGDGGIDGRIKVDGKTFIIQSKKYKTHINNKDVAEFNSVASRYDGGFFVHTGKTGKQSWQARGNIHIISGDLLLRLLKGNLQLDRYLNI